MKIAVELEYTLDENGGDCGKIIANTITSYMTESKYGFVDVEAAT